MKMQSTVTSRERQQGMVLEIVLVVLVALLLASVSLFRSVDTSSTVSGNIAFKSDANNRAQLAFDQVIAWTTNAKNFDTYITNGVDLPSRNYSARMLEVDAQGIPVVLRNLDTFDASYTHAPPATALMNAEGMRVRYLAERMCTTNGALNKNHCTYAYEADEVENGPIKIVKEPDKPALRVTVRVDGPRNTVSFIQATVRP